MEGYFVFFIGAPVNPRIFKTLDEAVACAMEGKLKGKKPRYIYDWRSSVVVMRFDEVS